MRNINRDHMPTFVEKNSGVFSGAFKANDVCYESGNILGDVHGYCKRFSDTSYVACAPE